LLPVLARLTVGDILFPLFVLLSAIFKGLTNCCSGTTMHPFFLISNFGVIMKRLPSVKTLAEVFGDRAKEARKILEMTREELATLPAGEARIKECLNPPKTYNVRMNCLNAICDGSFGVEGFQLDNGEWCDYLNTGDTYTPTLLYVFGKYRVGCWGDIAEKFVR